MSGIVCLSIFVRGNQRTKEWYEKYYKKHFNGSDILVTGDDINWCKKKTYNTTKHIFMVVGLSKWR